VQNYTIHSAGDLGRFNGLIFVTQKMAPSWEKAEVAANAHVPLSTVLAQYPVLEVSNNRDVAM
jgi:hypothetical protein